MKTEELTALGIDKDTAAKIFAMNGKDIESAKAAKDKEIETLKNERNGYKSQLDTATDTLKKFEGVNLEQVQNELKTYKDKADEAEKKFAREIMQRDQKDWLKAKLDEYGVKSPLARKQITQEVMSEADGLKWQVTKDGKEATFFGFDDYMKAAKEEDNTLYMSAEEKAEAEKQQQQQKKAPSFTAPAGNAGGTDEKYTPPLIF